MAGRVEALAVDGLPGKPQVPVAGSLIEVALLSSFETARTLEYHLLEGANIFEVQAVGANTIDAYIANHQHAELALAFCLGSNKSGQQLRFFGVRLDHSHLSQSHPF